MEKDIGIYKYIAQALASRYEVIYYVDIITNEYTEYISSKEYSKLNVGSSGSDFFAESQKNMKRDIFPEDQPMMSECMEKSNLLDSLDKNGKIFLDYRLMLDGRPQYVTLMALYLQNDKNHIIVAVDNIDAAKQKELAFERIIGSAMDMANKDTLTGVKNKHSYVQVEMLMDDEIAGNDQLEFAIVICDINGLKQVNDEQGHSAGDEFIKKASSIICKIFAHSPVFRIGGDEFVVILKGSDYEDRHKLLAQFGTVQVENREKGLVTLAFGMSDYRPKKDNRVQDVFERADNLMYENKKCFKRGEDFKEEEEDENNRSIKFYQLYEQLGSAMTEIGKADFAYIKKTIADIARMFRLSNGVVRLYRNQQEELSGGGETINCFDTGVEGCEVSSLRVVTSVMSIATITVFMSPDEKPLTEEERWRVELVMRTTLSFVSRNRLKDIVEELAYYDEFGYPNLRNLTQYIMKMIKTGDIHGRMAFRYNLRHFSVINQDFGREAGDRIMKLHCELLKKIMGEDSIAARLGGDNFVGICRSDRLKSVHDFLYETEISVDRSNSVNIQARAGIFCMPDSFEARNPGDILVKINNAYNMAREGERDTIVFYDEALLEKRQKSLKIQKLMPEAIRNGEFMAYYQPKVNIFSGKLEGAEALCRWIHDGKIIFPNDFVPMLEETSDICRLDLYMLEKVCKDLRRWIDEGRDIVRISVNFSRKNIMNVGLPEIIEEIVDRYEIPHEYIEIELTETTTDVEFGDLKRIASNLHSQGFYTSVDDFGVGFSSLNLIREIPWNVVKIDRSFLPLDDESDSSTLILFRHVVSMTRQLGLECIAEGVETEKQLNLLRENNCELAQGYLFDKPLPVTEFEKRLIDKKYFVN